MRTFLIYAEYPAIFWSFKYALKFIHDQNDDRRSGLGESGGDLRRPLGVLGPYDEL